MAQDVLKRLQSSKTILIEDSTEQSGRPFLRAWLKFCHNRDQELNFNVWNLSSLQELQLQTLNQISDKSSRLTVVDLNSDPEDWDSDEIITFESKTSVFHLPVITENYGLLLIDDLSRLIMLRSTTYTCKTINAISRSKDIEQCVSLIHSDVHDLETLSAVRHCFSVVVCVAKPKLQQYNFLLHVLVKKPSGKIIMSHHHLKISESFDILECIEYAPITEEKYEEPEKDPTSNLTFNLNLNEQAKVARRNLVLPHIKDVQLNESSSSKIFYQPDEADDFDEEDPDDDLDI